MRLPIAIRECFILVLLLPLLLGLASCGKGQNALSTIQRAEELSFYYLHHEDVKFLESELRKKPGNESILEFLMSYYYKHGRDKMKLQEFTLQMVKFHPGDSNIFTYTYTEFYVNPRFRDEVTAALEGQIPDHPKEAGLYWNLASIHQSVGIPPLPKDVSPERRERWFRYFDVPPTTPIPTEINHAIAAKSESYFRKAISLVKGDKFYYSFYSSKLAKLLLDLDRGDEAIATYEDAISHAEPKYAAGYHFFLADIYRKRKEHEKARQHFHTSVQNDDEGNPGKGHITVWTYTSLGLMALSQGKVAEAEKDLLLSATEPKPYIHTITQGMPLDLAEALIAKGHTEVARDYLKIVLQEFTPHDQHIKDLLDSLIKQKVSQKK